MPIIPGGEIRVGLGLWNSWTGSTIVELVFFCAGLFIYTEATRVTDSIGRYGLWSFVALLVIGWVSTLFAGAPPSVNVLAAGALTIWITVPMGLVVRPPPRTTLLVSKYRARTTAISIETSPLPQFFYNFKKPTVY